MRFILLGLLTVVLAVPASAADKRLMTVDDLSRLKTVGAPAIDPSGSWVAYSVAQDDVESDKNFSHIWMTSWDGARTVQLTSRKGESESTPRWSVPLLRSSRIRTRDRSAAAIDHAPKPPIDQPVKMRRFESMR